MAVLSSWAAKLILTDCSLLQTPVLCLPHHVTYQASCLKKYLPPPIITIFTYKMVSIPIDFTSVTGILGIIASTAFASTTLSISSLTSSALLLPPKPHQDLQQKNDDSSQKSRQLACQWEAFEVLAHKVSMSCLVVGTSSFIYAGLKCPASAML